MATAHEPRDHLGQHLSYSGKQVQQVPSPLQWAMRIQSYPIIAALLAIAFLVPAFAEDQPTATPSPVPVSAIAPVPVAPSESETPPHAFWDRSNFYLFSGVALVRGLDYASTRNFLARGRQEILIPDDIVYNSAGFASLEAAATLTSVGLSYWMHRAGHHKIERWISIGHIGVTGFGVARNYSLKSKHP